MRENILRSWSVEDDKGARIVITETKGKKEVVISITGDESVTLTQAMLADLFDVRWSLEWAPEENEIAKEVVKDE